MRKALHKNQILILLALAQFMVVLDTSIVNVALPAIFRDLHFSEANLQWVVTAYTLSVGGFLLFGGRAADLYGRRKMFLYGVIAFTIVSFLAGLAQTSGQLIALRAVQGLAAAFMSPAALSIIVHTYKEGTERNRALGVWGGVAAGGAAAGLLFGGILTEYLGWRWNFFVNVPVGLAVALLAPRIIPESKANLKHVHLDLPGAVLVTSGLMSLVYGLVKAPSYGWTDMQTVLILGASVSLLAAFVVNELRSKQPLVPFSVFKIGNLRAANMVQLPVTASMFSMFFFLTLYIQNVLGYSPIRTGFAFLPVTFIIGIGSAIISKEVSRIGYKIPMIVGPLLLAGGLLYFSRLPVDGHYLTDVLPGLGLMATGLGFMFVSTTIAATTGVPHDKSGLASGILNTSQQIGGALGLAILSGVYAAELKDARAHGLDQAAAQVQGFHEAFLVGGGFAILASIIAATAIKHIPGEKPTAEAVHIG